MSKISDDELADQITHGFLRIFNKIQQGRRAPRHFGNVDSLTLIEAEMCIIISQRPGISGKEFAKLLGVTPSATSQAISKLKEKGCIRQETDGVNAKNQTSLHHRKRTRCYRCCKCILSRNEKRTVRNLTPRFASVHAVCSKLENFHDSIRKIMDEE